MCAAPLQVGTSVVQLGRNAAANGNGFGSGRYDLSGGILATAFIRYGQVVSGAGVIDTNPSTCEARAGSSLARSRSFNTAATNTFNFTGGTLTANTIGIPITNNERHSQSRCRQFCRQCRGH
jgi:hypothetical protein